jgi:predicted dehydrogenase
MNTLNVGIIGYGWAAGAHIAAINSIPGAQVTGVYSSRPLDAAELSARHGSDILVYSELDALLADPTISVVSITSRHGEHAAQAIRAAREGKHLIIEKPIALTLEECRAVEEAVRESRVRACVCFECRFSSQLRATRAVIDEGLLGRIHYAEVDYYHGIGPWYGQYRWNIKKDEGGSSLLTAGCHAMDALLFCMGDAVEEVTSYSTGSGDADFARYEYDTTTVTLIKFAGGRIGKVTSCIDCHQPYYFHLHLVGSEGSLLDNRFHSLRLALNKAAWSTLSMKLLDSGDVTDHPYRAQFEAFFEAIGRNEEMPLTSLDQALRTHEVVFAADRSAELGRTVKLSELSGG